MTKVKFCSLYYEFESMREEKQQQLKKLSKDKDMMEINILQHEIKLINRFINSLYYNQIK